MRRIEKCSGSGEERSLPFEWDAHQLAFGNEGDGDKLVLVVIVVPSFVSVSFATQRAVAQYEDYLVSAKVKIYSPSSEAFVSFSKGPICVTGIIVGCGKPGACTRWDVDHQQRAKVDGRCSFRYIQYTSKSEGPY